MKLRWWLATAPLMLAALALLWTAPAFSFLVDYVAFNGGSPRPAKWDFSAGAVQWNVNPSAGANIQGGRPPADVIAAAFGVWAAAPNTALSISRGANSSATALPPSTSTENLVCFVCNDSSFSDNKTLAITYTNQVSSAGQPNARIVHSHILFNPSVTFSTDGATGQDLQTVATHEIGHFFGVSHSAVSRSLMFPASPDVLRTLSYDDVAAMSVLYPKATPDVPTGAIAGSVRQASGSPVFGAHVYADSTTAAQPYGGSVRKSPIGAMSFPDGTYTIQGLPADSYIVIAEPLDDPVTDSDLGDFASVFGHSAVQTNFTTRWH
jgi:hypothetical protein